MSSQIARDDGTQRQPNPGYQRRHDLLLACRPNHDATIAYTERCCRMKAVLDAGRRDGPRIGASSTYSIASASSRSSSARMSVIRLASKNSLCGGISLATTPVPTAVASAIGKLNPSQRLGTTRAFAVAYSRASSTSVTSHRSSSLPAARSVRAPGMRRTPRTSLVTQTSRPRIPRSRSIARTSTSAPFLELPGPTMSAKGPFDSSVGATGVGSKRPRQRMTNDDHLVGRHAERDHIIARRVTRDDHGVPRSTPSPAELLQRSDATRDELGPDERAKIMNGDDETPSLRCRRNGDAFERMDHAAGGAASHAHTWFSCHRPAAKVAALHPPALRVADLCEVGTGVLQSLYE